MGWYYCSTYDDQQQTFFIALGLFLKRGNSSIKLVRIVPNQINKYPYWIILKYLIESETLGQLLSLCFCPWLSTAPGGSRVICGLFCQRDSLRSKIRTTKYFKTNPRQTHQIQLNQDQPPSKPSIKKNIQTNPRPQTLKIPHQASRQLTTPGSTRLPEAFTSAVKPGSGRAAFLEKHESKPPKISKHLMLFLFGLITWLLIPGSLPPCFHHKGSPAYVTWPAAAEAFLWKDPALLHSPSF